MSATVPRCVRPDILRTVTSASAGSPEPGPDIVPAGPALPGRPARPGGDARPGLTVCSLCVGETLGTGDPRVGGQLARLQDLERAGTTRLTLVECLDECERGDVVVVRPTRAARRRAHTPVWLERLAGDGATAALDGWLRAGGPGTAPVPTALVGLVIDRDGSAEDVTAAG
ncbi:hypothetical protein AGMMS50218_07760 [Actinomycetota bacterium]|nr:hypothetical protein AGMMS50218_07760 [Actinomycetota bacterium]